MSLFQHSVLNKYLKETNQTEVISAYKKLVAYFHNPVIQQNIRDSKEEQWQEGFLTELFAKILGYAINPNPDFNLTTEFKNERGAKKADGAILKEGAAIGVIELKSTTTKDLEAIRLQAFDYKANHSKCVFVITSNFEKIRFYINNAVDYEEFDLFKINYEEFQLLWLCLAKENLLKGIPLSIKEDSVIKEENVTKQIYIDYTAFKRDLYNDLIENNLNLENFRGKEEKEIKLLLFKKSQKLLDRFLFIFFGEDRGLLPPNSISEIIKQWENQSDWGDEITLYDRYKKYFHLLNTGWKGKKYEIYAYNGGLFAPDEILDSIKISDEILRKHTKILTSYDFESDVDVNILGHIFENSLNEIEEVSAQIEGAEVDLKKSKRKKDGVFYTPKYITKYIVENTVGKLCTEKKTELEIEESEYLKNRKGRTTKKLKELDEKLSDYRNWLLTLTICDPACGSGAFLNQALDFLIREHQTIDELRTKLLDVPMIFTEVENRILENNIFGVDINEESIEIAKLSLWLRTAQKGRKLTTLSNNIKCGNSLIDDPEVAGEKAFNWQNEFSEVFKNGGFDVVIGNPPYLRIQGLQDAYPELVKYYGSTYISATGNYDVYALFIEKSFKLINKVGHVSLILPHKFLIADFGIGIRKYLLQNKAVNELVNFGSELVFQDATTYTCIISLTKQKKSFINFRHISPIELFNEKSFSQILYEKLDEGQWFLTNNKIGNVLDKISKQPFQLKNIFDRFVQGIITGKDAVFCISGKIKGNYLELEGETENKSLIERNILKPHLRGEDVNKFKDLINKEWLIFPYKLDSDKAELYSPDEMQGKFPNAYKYLMRYEKELRDREYGKFNNDYWYQYSRNQAISVLEQPKIITPEVCFGGSMTLDINNFYHNSKCHTLLLNPKCGYELKSILPFLNSRLFWFYLSNTGNVLRGGYIGVKRRVLELFPIPSAKMVIHEDFVYLSESILTQTANHQSVQSNFINLLQSNFKIEKLSNKLQNWPELEFKDFLIELKKVKVKLTLSQEAEWMQYFNEQKQKAQTLKAEIDKTDREIDRMVYKLYGLTEEEIGIVEENTK